MERPGKRKRGRSQRRLIVLVKEDLQKVGVTEGDAGIWWDGDR